MDRRRGTAAAAATAVVAVPAAAVAAAATAIVAAPAVAVAAVLIIAVLLLVLLAQAALCSRHRRRPESHAPAARGSLSTLGVLVLTEERSKTLTEVRMLLQENAPLQAQPTVSAAHCRLCVLAPRCCCCSAHRVAARRCGPHLAPELVVPGSRGHLVREASRIALAVRRVQRRPTIRSSSIGSCIHALQRDVVGVAREPRLSQDRLPRV
jgi:hypothetical protein